MAASKLGFTWPWKSWISYSWISWELPFPHIRDSQSKFGDPSRASDSLGIPVDISDRLRLPSRYKVGVGTIPPVHCLGFHARGVQLQDVSMELLKAIAGPMVKVIFEATNLKICYIIDSYLYVYVYIYIYAYVYLLIYIYMCIYNCIYIYTYIRIYTVLYVICMHIYRVILE